MKIMESGKRIGAALLAAPCAIAAVFAIAYGMMVLSLGLEAPLASLYVSATAVGIIIPGLLVLNVFYVAFPRAQ